jgi:uncharacterized protein YndB with AHSA1/START domain
MGDSPRRPQPGGGWAAPAERRRECHVRAIRPAYDDEMSKVARTAAMRSVVAGARSRESRMPYTFTLTATIPASPEDIYQAWLDSIGHSEMTGGEATTSDEVGAEVSAWDGYISGRNLELVSGERIVQSWRTSEFGDEDEDSVITVVLQETEDGTLLTLEHSNVPDEHKSYEQGGWQSNYFEPMAAYFTELKEDAELKQNIAAPAAPKPPPKSAPKKPAKTATKQSAKAGRKKIAGKARRHASAKPSKRSARRKASSSKKAAPKKSKAKANARATTARTRAKSSARKGARGKRR